MGNKKDEENKAGRNCVMCEREGKERERMCVSKLLASTSKW